METIKGIIRFIWDVFVNALFVTIYGFITWYLIERVVNFDTGLVKEDFMIRFILIWYGSILVVKNYLKNYKDNY